MLALQLKNNLTKTEIHPSIYKKTVHIQNLIWSVGFLSWFSTYVFITNFELNGYVYILEIVLNILDKLINDSQIICGCLILKAITIKLKSLISSLINEKITSTSSTPSLEKKMILYIAHLIIFCSSTKTSIY